MAKYFFFMFCLLCAMHGTVPWMTVTPLCPPSPARCRYDASVIDEHFYFVEDKKFKIVYAEKYLSVSCPENATLESVSMPRFERMVRVQRVELTACVPPAGPYARALARLNISVLDLLVLVRPRGALRPHHFDGINVSALFIRGSEPVQLERGTLASLYALLDLRLERVSLTDSDLMEMPVGLRRLSISSCNVSLLGSALDRLQELVHVVVREPRLHQAPDLRAVASLRDAVFVAPLDVVPMSTSLENVTVWSAQRLELYGGCEALVRLRVSGRAGAGAGWRQGERVLATSWLAGCSRLRELELQQLHLVSLPGGMLHAARDLRSLVLRGCQLTELPPELLAESRELRLLDLSNNKLETLPQGLFASVRSLEQLQLSENRLSRAGAAPAFALRSLWRLALARNPLADLCDVSTALDTTNAVSEVWQMRKLRELRLASTNATRICTDWRRELRALELLDLQHNRIEHLHAADLQWERSQPSRVLLGGNAVRSLSLSREDYEQARAQPPPLHTTRLELDATLRCDCGVYWVARLAREAGAGGSALRGARCADGRALAELRAEQLACALPAASCAPRCTCELRGLLVRADCEHRQLTSVPHFPRLPHPPPAVLLLRNNSIAHFGPDDLPPTLQLVDLSYNRLSDVSAESAAALFAGPERRVRLAGNALACCGALAAAARFHSARLLDASAPCGSHAHCGALPWRAPAAAAGAALLLAAALAAATLARPAARADLKRFLCTLWSHRSPDAEDDRPYDVFVSFSHNDHAVVTDHLVPGLESGERPYRVCVHYRDWAPGDWIPAQIARSVNQARRTLIVVSQHWVESTWARAEFREAQAAALREARPRLVAVLLDEPARLSELEPELREYLAANTYLRWDDPAFWPKLRRALPTPAPATTSAAITSDTPTAAPALFTSPVA